MVVVGDFGTEVGRGLTAGRALAESLMTGTCVVERKTGTKSQNETTGKVTADYAVVFASKCKVQDQARVGGDADVAGRREAPADVRIDLPWDSPAVRTDDRITITAIGPTWPSRLLGARFIVGTSHDKAFQTAMRLPVTESA